MNFKNGLTSKTLSLPIALTYIADDNAESIPPDTPITTLLIPIDFINFLMP